MSRSFGERVSRPKSENLKRNSSRLKKPNMRKVRGWRKETIQDALRRIESTRNGQVRGKNNSNGVRVSYHRLEHQGTRLKDDFLPHLEEVSHLERSRQKGAAIKHDKLGNHSPGKNWSYRENGGRAVEDISYTSKVPTGVDVDDAAKVIDAQTEVSSNASLDDYDLSLEDVFPEHKEEVRIKPKIFIYDNCEWIVLSDMNDNTTNLVAGECEQSTERKEELSESSSSVTIGKGLNASRNPIYLAYYRKRLQELELERDQLVQARTDLEEQEKVEKSSLLKHLTERFEMKVKLDILLAKEDKEN